MHSSALDINQIKSEVFSYLSGKSDTALLSPQDGYYPFDTIADAYEKGYETGYSKGHQDGSSNVINDSEFRKQILVEKYRNMVVESFKKAVEALDQVLSHHDIKDIGINKVFFSLKAKQAVIGIAINESDYNNEKKLFKLFDIQANTEKEFISRNHFIEFITMRDTQQLSLRALSDDGFMIQYDLNENKLIHADESNR